MVQVEKLLPGFEVIFDNGRVQIIKNPTDEIIVKDVRSGASIQMFSTRQGLGFMPLANRVEPIIVEGNIGYEIRECHEYFPRD